MTLQNNNLNCKHLINDLESIINDSTGKTLNHSILYVTLDNWSDISHVCVSKLNTRKSMTSHLIKQAGLIRQLAALKLKN